MPRFHFTSIRVEAVALPSVEKRSMKDWLAQISGDEDSLARYPNGEDALAMQIC
ncbi:MAG: hypothetical protein ACOYYS_22150 [Chloroflexota bacterium]